MCRAKVFNIFLYTFIKHSWSDLMSNKEYRNKTIHNTSVCSTD